MLNRKQKEIHRLNERCVELAQQLRDSNLENKQLKEIRLLEVRNNTKILEQNNKKAELINNIAKALYCNIKTDKQKLEKLKELVSDYQSIN